MDTDNIKTKAEYDAALERIDELMKSDSPHMHKSEIEHLSKLLEEYVEKNNLLPDLPDEAEKFDYEWERDLKKFI